jgi:hypothetical protein
MSNHITDSLRELGFTENCIVETILVTMNQDCTQNPAPMGLTKTGSILTVKVYKTSRTYENLLRGGTVYVNITNDPMIFLECAFKEHVTGTLAVTEGRIQDSAAVITADVSGQLSQSELYAVFELTPINVEVYKPMPIALSRGRAAAVEAVIDATRIQVFQSDGRLDDVTRLVSRVKNNIDTVEKVSGEGSAEADVIRILVSMIKEWGVKW